MLEGMMICVDISPSYSSANVGVAVKMCSKSIIS